MKRRRFLQTLGLSTAAMLADGAAARGQGSAAASAGGPPKYLEWLTARHKNVMSAERLDAFLQAPPNNSWSKFDHELGYVPKESIQRDGIDGSHVVYRYGPGGERKMINYADRPCRMNTYGDSFTHCDHVSDGETWQEHLAAHLGEPSTSRVTSLSLPVVCASLKVRPAPITMGQKPCASVGTFICQRTLR